MSVHIAAIVKGLIEQGDGTVHFGSLMGYGYHLSAAKDAGVVAEGPNGMMVTPLGVKWYKSERMSEISENRCAYWKLGKNYDWTPPSNAQAQAHQPESVRCNGTL